jgi:AbrB family looped-hinge helix DNA binding protein
MEDFSSTFTSKGQVVVPAALRRKHGIVAGTRVKFVEDQFGRIILQPVTEEYIDRVMGCLKGGTDLVAALKAERRREGKARP